MAHTKLIIKHHPSDASWARRLRRVADAAPDVSVIADDAPEAAPVSTTATADAIADEGASQRLVTLHVCSPAYAAAQYTPGAGDHIALIVAGEPGASRFEGAEDEDCLPSMLSAAPRIEARPDRRAPDDALQEAIARALDVPEAEVRRYLRRRRFRRAGAAAVFGVIAAGLIIGGIAAMDYRREAAQTDASAAAIDDAIAALDRGDDAATYGAVARAFASGGGGPRADAVLTRAALETRLLADILAPSDDIRRLSFLPDGVIAATGGDGGAWLIDPGVGAVTEINAPTPSSEASAASGRHVVTRVSPGGEMLWTAEPGEPSKDETGAPFVPLRFADISLAEAAVVGETVIRSPVGRFSDGVISPDGKLFAADLGPGAGVETLVGVFRRDEQSLAGVLRLPSDAARLMFVGPGHLLAIIEPPSAYGSSPGLYLWRVGAAEPMELRHAGAPPVCPADAVRADPATVREAQAQGRIIAPQVLAAPNGREIALLSPRLGRGACLLRWSAPDGAPLETITVPGRAQGGAILAEGGPYLIHRKGGPATLLRPGAPATALDACRDGVVLPLSRPGASAGAFLCGAGDDGVLADPAGVSWRRRMHSGGVIAAAAGPEGRIVTAGRDGRIRVWDGALRQMRGPQDLREAKSYHVVPSQDGASRVAALFANGLVRVLDVNGAATGVSVPTGLTRATARVVGPNLLAVLGGQDGAQSLRIVDIGAGAALSRSWTFSADTRFLGDTAMIKGDGAHRVLIRDGDGAVRVEPLSSGGLVEVVAADLVVGGAQGDAVALVERSRARADAPVRVTLEHGDAAHRLEFTARRATLRLAPSGAHALLRIEDRTPPYDEDFYLLDMETGERKAVPLAPVGSTWFEFSASGDAFAIRPLDTGADISVFSTDSGERIGAVKAGRLTPRWAPVGDVLATGGDGRITLSIVEDETARALCEITGAPARHLAFTPDGGAVAAGARVGGLIVLGTANCTVLAQAPDLRLSAPPFAPAADLVWAPTPTGPAIVAVSVDKQAALAVLRRRARVLAATE